ncbi:54S ribosomal protein-like protein [Hapsidospora chrysogenum ATCC 11550]|uniref:54S ribosomal protein-like protein n=1 Tax=Hapsidospora chrysogenum (strain ATCC 11550 / CBS 779.69 / DSM 880 / IAM 14645 / JCM 23072 / IMI 49137) TaxID=857340 RepID=A0A086T6R3_HAPC1|nr:54S ribosomal protein-like protein [Hapsidospora chrysogenum ATCC 11550]
MDMRALARPASELLTRARCQASLPITAIRGHKTTARTKRALKIAPHDSFLPDRSPNAPTGDSIIYNPPASEASPLHTPFLFLPPNDPRRSAIVRMRAANEGFVPGSSPTNAQLPPAMKYARRQPRYNLTAKDLEEMRRLRNEDPLKWSVGALAQKFDCSRIIVKIAAPPPESHKKWLKELQERREARWGPRRAKAREERKMRNEMMHRGEL